MQEKNNSYGVFTITNKTRNKKPNIPFSGIKDSVLGEDYSLSLVFVGNKLSRQLNKKYRNKDESANILSFPLTKTEGEIFINLSKAKKEASEFSMTYNEFIAYLFIHGILHLKGMQHSSTMYKREMNLLKRFVK